MPVGAPPDAKDARTLTMTTTTPQFDYQQSQKTKAFRLSFFVVFMQGDFLFLGKTAFYALKLSFKVTIRLKVFSLCVSMQKYPIRTN